MHTSEAPKKPKNEYFNKKMYFNIKIHFLLKFSVLGVVGTSEVCSVCMGWMCNYILHPMSPQTGNLC